MSRSWNRAVRSDVANNLIRSHELEQDDGGVVQGKKSFLSRIVSGPSKKRKTKRLPWSCYVTNGSPCVIFSFTRHYLATKKEKTI